MEDGHGYISPTNDSKNLWYIHWHYARPCHSVASHIRFAACTLEPASQTIAGEIYCHGLAGDHQRGLCIFSAVIHWFAAAFHVAVCSDQHGAGGRVLHSALECLH